MGSPFTTQQAIDYLNNPELNVFEKSNKEGAYLADMQNSRLNAAYKEAQLAQAAQQLKQATRDAQQEQLMQDAMSQAASAGGDNNALLSAYIKQALLHGKGKDVTGLLNAQTQDERAADLAYKKALTSAANRRDSSGPDADKNITPQKLYNPETGEEVVVKTRNEKFEALQAGFEPKAPSFLEAILGSGKLATIKQPTPSASPSAIPSEVKVLPNGLKIWRDQ
jgi:hypothetical protein